MSLLQEKSHRSGRRWNISGSTVAAFEPFLLSLSDDAMTLWDRRDGSAVQHVTVKGHVFSVIAALGDLRTGQTIYLFIQHLPELGFGLNSILFCIFC